jgi:hypothetical protein
VLAGTVDVLAGTGRLRQPASVDPAVEGRDGRSEAAGGHLIQGENAPRPARPFRGERAARTVGPVAGLHAGPQPKG